MLIQRGELLRGVTRHGEPSANSVFRGDVRFQDGQMHRGFIKDLDPRQFGNELLVAVLAAHLRVNVPEDAIVRVSAEVSRDFKAIPTPDGKGSIAFFSADAEGSTVLQIIRGGIDVSGVTAVREAPQMGRMYGLDTWVANIDRHANNLIVSGDGRVFLIDHGHCFSGPGWKPADLSAPQEYICKLKQWLTPQLSVSEKDQAMSDISALAASMMGLDVQKIIVDSLASQFYGANDSDSLVGFLEARVEHVLPLSAKSLGTI